MIQNNKKQNKKIFLTHLAGIQASDVCAGPAALPELVEKLFPVLIKITFTLGEILVYQSVRTVLVTHVEDGFLLLLLLLGLHLLDPVVPDLRDLAILALAQEAEALGAPLGLPELGRGRDSAWLNPRPHDKKNSQQTDPALQQRDMNRVIFIA